MSHTNEVQFVTNGGWDERILICRNAPLVDTFIVVTERYVVLVDTMINPSTAEKIMERANEHLVDGRLLLVVNTHADYDHCWGNQLFAGPRALYPAPIIGSRLCAARFADPDAETYLLQLRQQEPEIFDGVRLTPPTVTFEGALTIAGGDMTLQIFMAPGHTADHAAIYIPEINTLLAADGAELPYPMARTPPGLPRMRQSLAAMIALNPETALYCHAPTTLGPQLLYDNVTYFDRLEAACRAALARGVPVRPGEGEDVIALIGLPYAGTVPDTELWHSVHEYYRTTGHARQLRMMLASLAKDEADE